MFPKKSFREQPQQAANGLRINDQIKAWKVRLIDQNGENVGVIGNKEALQKSREVGLDLVEIAPEANPPVAKIMDYGKYVFEQKKKVKDNTHKAPDDKEIRLTPNIEIADLEVKVKKIQEFIEEGSKVTLSFKLRGREMKHQYRCVEVVKKVTEIIKDIANVEEKGGVWIVSRKA